MRWEEYKKIEKDLGQYDKIKNILGMWSMFFYKKKIFEDHNGFDERFWAHMEEIDCAGGFKIQIIK